MGKIKLGKYIEEYSQKNKTKKTYPVYSVTNSNGFCTEYFTKDVSSEDKSGYKIVPYGYFAYNPSRINVGSVDCQTKEENVIVSPLYTVFKVSDGLDIEYLRYFFKSNYCKYLIKSKVSGSVRFNLKFKTLCSFEINEIDLEGQKKAVELFNSIEDLIKTEERELLLCDELIKSRFNELFIGKGYSKIQIRELIDLKKITTKKLYKDSDEFEYIDISSIDNQRNEIISSTTYKLGDAPSRAQQCLKHNDILVSTVRPNLRNIARFKGPNNGFVGSSGFCVLRANRCDASYLMYNILSDDFTESMIRLTTGASYPAIRDEDVFDYEVINAPLSIQDQFAEFIDKIDKLKFNVQKRIEKYKELLNKKMDEYFN